MLASILSRIRQVRAESKANPGDAEAQKLYEQLLSEQWARVIEVGKDCMLSEESIKRVLWEPRALGEMFQPMI